MANNPVQIVLNAQNYVRRSEISPGGSIKDFYAGRNEDFARHRDALASQLNELQHPFPGAQPDDVFYARVSLQADAWAKSHRPINKVFQPNNQAYVGGAELGSMVVELTPNDIPRIAAVVAAAESVVKQVEKNDKLVEKPSRARSEVGAIESVRNYSASDRRKFSTEQAMRWLADPRTGSAYYVETFVSWKSIEGRRSDNLKERGARALSKFEARLKELDLPIEISMASDEWINASIYIIKITEYPLNSPSNIATHTALLEFLDNEPVVKAVHLPPILQAAHVSGESETQLTIAAPIEGKSYPIIGIIDTGVSKIPALSAWSAGSIDFISETTQDVSHGTFIAGLLCAADVLNHDPLTLVFNGVLTDGHELQFQFSWPANLVNERGGCSGNVKLTVVYKPPTDRKFGGEFVRINLDAYLRQEEVSRTTGEISFKGRLKGDGAKTYEKELIRHGAKWWPVKRLKGNFKSIGKSSQWRLVIDPLARSEYAIPSEGIPFSVILTIADSERTSPIFNQMRQQLQSAGATISDIRSALRPRVR